MKPITWDSVAHEFAFDGSWRDIYILDTDLQAWQRVLDALKGSRYEIVYQGVNGVIELPLTAADAFRTGGEIRPMLTVGFAGIEANCHFFAPEEVEFDLDPREVQGQSQLDALLTFMRLLSDATGKDAVLTPENLREGVIFRSRPRDPEVKYYEVGGWHTIE